MFANLILISKGQKIALGGPTFLLICTKRSLPRVKPPKNPDEMYPALCPPSLSEMMNVTIHPVVVSIYELGSLVKMSEQLTSNCHLNTDIDETEDCHEMDGTDGEDLLVQVSATGRASICLIRRLAGVSQKHFKDTQSPQYYCLLSVPHLVDADPGIPVPGSSSLRWRTRH
jgi:hypothetical protein